MVVWIIVLKIVIFEGQAIEKLLNGEKVVSLQRKNMTITTKKDKEQSN